ncbi:hypothetical protein NUSPORA_02245 [Nucleospora cyclopteri]
MSNFKVCPMPSANRLTILRSVFSSIEELQESEWLRNAYEVIHTKLGRLKLLPETFCDKFSKSILVPEAKIFATKKRSSAELIIEK